jgi:hypothetical protein
MFRQLKLINNSNKGKQNALNARKIPSIHTRPINPNKIQKKKQGTSVRKIPNYVDEKQQTHRTSHRSAK